MNDKINVEKTIRAILEQEGQEKGINLIREIVNNIAKNRRRKKTRGNTYDSIALEVYSLIYNKEFMRERAIEKVSEDKSIALSTVKNHLSTFDNKAKKDNYMNFGYWTEYNFNNTDYGKFREIDDESIIKEAIKKEFTGREGLSYYLKYKIEIRKGKKFTPDISYNNNLPF